MPSSSLLKTPLHTSVAQGLYNEISSRTSRYYYFLGKTIEWEDETLPPYPIDSDAYEFDTRKEMITLKEVKATDVSFVIPKYTWASGTIYDQYDNQYSTEVQGINLTAPGYGYGSAPYIYIGSTGSVNWTANTVFIAGDFLSYQGRYYAVTVGGTSNTVAPTHTSGSVANGSTTLKYIAHNDASGSGATASCTVLDGEIIDIQLLTRGVGYLDIPSVTIIGGGGQDGDAEAVVTIGNTGAQKIEDAVFYVITDENNVYKCLDNNLGALSTSKPIGTAVDPYVATDGYMWKFMYAIPLALRNKFLTEEYMPVVTALRNQFYSNGNLNTIRIDAAGSGYTTGAITVTGDGYSEANPIYLTGYVIGDGGADYTSPTVSIEPPFDGVATWSSETLAIVNQKLAYNDNIYRVAVSGITNTTGPSHRFGIVQNGDAALEYVGTTATATAEETAGEITNIILNQMIRDIQVENNGAGYTVAPSVSFTGDGTDASATAVLQNGSVIKIVINDPGTGYTTEPTVVIGSAWTASTVVTIGEQIYQSTRLYTVTGDGTTHASIAPTHSSGSASNGTATLEYVGSPAVAVATLKCGAGYSTNPSITISGGAGTGVNAYFTYVSSTAKLIPIFSNESIGSQWETTTAYTSGQKVWYETRLYTVTVSGTSGATAPSHVSGIVANGDNNTCVLQFTAYMGQLIGVQIDDAGVGYTTTNINVTGDGTGATISADLSPGDINTLQANIELLTVDGRIMNCPVISGGWGYGGNPTITITGDGAGATAEAVIDNGKVVKINMTNYGYGYRWANVLVTGTGYGAKARAILSPYGGHGKHAIENLFARTLMFYSNISRDKNQGFTVNNDFRQAGLLKNVRQYGNTLNLTSIAASACWVIAGTINTTLFPADSIITRSSDSARFRIVTNTGTAILVQSVDNEEPAIGDNFLNDEDDLFTVSAVTPPNADKYSGDIIFIDNRQAFTPTEDQTITLRTVIRF